ncbi:putative centrosome microtubule-binding domain of Cep57 [Lyophyllum shimeji]|uniref:Centrosome microtubule-binding domain of Cep57 n=1 Tax=Lyophyllum shimeji TaxID=47721 RepID=A0A9P3ULZ4_LYOSH|nr:putative centrosome microtubule-binding domain of Cep57 [Lyophyllum shimeji]
MKRHTRGLDTSIPGDELEHHRIQLEHNLQHTELSYRLSSVSDDEYNYHDSVEHPRHNSGPAPFPSFEIPSRDHFEGDTHSQIHPWSYRTVDDEEGINPYAGGETMSTAAHHASALTLSAGLGGGRAARRDISLSGAEYDPDRPLQDMIAGVNSKLSVFDIEPSRSKYPGVGSVTFDPLVVDSTAELDRVLQSGYAPAPATHIQSPLHSSSSSSASDSDAHAHPHNASRPKLSDALRRVSFSPRRPRSNPGSPRVSLTILPSNNTETMPTPKPKKRTASNIFPSSPAPEQPQVRLHPPTPSSSGSQFSKMARGITREIERAAQQQTSTSGSRSKHHAQERNPFDTSANTGGNSGAVRQPPPRKAPASAMKQHVDTPLRKVHLPDVTGLTSAVESPAKMGAEYYAYRAQHGSPREIEARLMGMLNTVQAKLQHLEEENGISRRRVRELELELDLCKRDVAKERTRVMEREEIIAQQQRDASYANMSGAAGRRNKGKAKARDTSFSGGERQREVLGERYREAVEEKKALEALITTLRTHLTRLTAELASHRELLTELRELRDSDMRALQQKSAEIERLREEVERLAGEVEVLRGVVEEGLKERRTGREVSSVGDSQADIAMSQDADDEDEEQRGAGVERSREQQDVNDPEGEGDQDDEPAPFDPVSIFGSSRNENISGTPRIADRTMRTDHATLGSSHLAQSQSRPASGQILDSAEFERISAEVEERRSMERSGSDSAVHASIPPIPSRRATVHDASDNDDDDDEHDEEEDSRRRGSPVPQASRTRSPHAPSSSRPAPTPGHRRRPQHISPADETPFPQIRGTHLERLFFSAPEHNATTCGVCHRHRRADVDEDVELSWLPSRLMSRRVERNANDREEKAEEDNDDEGFAEGSEQQQPEPDNKGKRPGGERVMLSKDCGRWRNEGLPPQTVVARVIRELEDDFTHYKGIYVELADQYKDMDAASDVPRRNVLAKHLREVVDILEQKGDQIASLSAKMRTVSTTAVAASSIGRGAGMGLRPHRGTPRTPSCVHTEPVRENNRQADQHPGPAQSIPEEHLHFSSANRTPEEAVPARTYELYLVEGY